MKKLFSLFVLASFLFLNVQGQVSGDFRSKTGGTGNWNDFNAWERYDGTNWVAATSGQLPLSTNATEIQAGHAMIINATGLVSGNLTVNGSLTYISTPASALTVSGSVTVSATGSFTSPTSGAVVTHALNIGGSTATGVGGNLLVDGIFNMNVFSTSGVIVTFFGTPNNTISGTGTTINFYSLVVNKGSSIASILDVTSVITIVPPVAAGIRLTITTGTFKLSSASSLSPYYGSQVICQGAGRLWINNASSLVQRVGSGTSAVAGSPSVYGTLQIDAGTFAYGSGSDLFITQGTILMGGPDATMNIYGGIGLSYGSTFIMTGGNVNIYMQAANNYTGSGLYFDLGSFTTNIFTFTGGNITIVDPSTSSTSIAVDFSHIYGTVTFNMDGGTLRLGNGTSDKAGNVNGFQINSGGHYFGNVVVNNNPSSGLATRIVKLSANSVINGNLTINSGTANQFLLNGKVLTLGGNIVNSGTFNGDATADGIIFNGSTQQVISGAGTFTNGNIRNITLNNTVVSTPALDLQANLSVSNALTLTKGTIGTTNSSVFTIGRSASSTTFTLTRSGGSLTLTPTFALGGVTTINYYYQAPVPAAVTTTGTELPVSTTLSTLYIQNTSGVTLDKAVNCNTLSLSGILNVSPTNTITVLGTTTGSVVGGSATAYVNGPLTRTIPNNAAAGNYKFPVGKNSAYELFEFASLTTGGTGTGTITVEVYNAGPYAATAGTGLSAVNTNKYWNVSTSLGSVTINASSTVRLTDAAGIGSYSKVAQSDNATGTYNGIGGIISGSTVTSVNPFDQSTLGAGTYFRIGTGANFSAGNYAIGPQASYAGYIATFPSMTAAIGAITNAPILGHVIFEFQSDYLPSVETYPITLTPSIFNDATKTVTFRPAASVSSLITFSSTGTVLSNTGADYIIIDGRNGGTGSNRFLKFASTSATAGAVTIGTSSSYNQFLYCLIKGSTTAASTGVMTIGSNINNFLVVDHCDLDGSGIANNCFYMTVGTTDVTITSNNFFDYRNGSGVYLPSGSNNAVIDNNNFYQTLAYNGFAGTTYGINVIGITNGIFSNNKIGGSGPGLTGTWTVTATSPAAYNFTGINATSLTTCKIYNNKIQNFDWKSNVSTWTGINAGGTSGSIGTDGANYIGSNTGNDNIKITYFSTGAPQFYGINIPGNGGNVACENNIIGSITTQLSGVTATGSSFTGIYSVNSGIINNNTIGSTTTPLSINLAAQSTAGNAQNVYGINFPVSSGAISITSNTIANINNGSTVASGSTRGIWVPNNGTAVNIASNSVFSISTSQPATGVGISASLTGIMMQSNAASGVTISGNQVYDLSNTAGAAAVTVDGICYSGSSVTNNKIEKNLIHSFKTASATAVQNGIHLYQGFCSTQNNVIRLGIDKNGSPITSTAQINGITKTSSAAGTFNFFFNTVYIGGSGVTAGAVTTRAFNLAYHSNEDIRNNIFINVRTNAVANPVHYALWLPAGITSSFISDYNIYNVSGTDGRLARVGATDQTNIGALQASFPGNDLNSGFGDPLLTNPAAALATMSLVPQNNTPAEGTGIAIGSVTDDFTGAARSGLTPTDIGAYAGNFTPPGAGQDIWFPVITYTPLLNTGLTTNRTTVSFATITDFFTGVNTTAGTKPRLYYKKSTDANAFAGNTSADNGWKWVEANNSTSPFDFTIDYSILTGGSVVIGDVIQYYVAAQDLATIPNVSFNPSNGASGSTVAPAGMTAPATLYSYGIVPTIASSVTVGTGYDYPTLTGAGGLFAAINGGVMNTNVVATIKTNTTEPGTYGLNLIIEEGPNAGTLTLTIQSDGVSHILSGGTSTLTTPLFLINGACRVTINGGSRLLTFRNANATFNLTGPVMQFQNGSQNCTVTQSVFESNSYGPAAGEIVVGSTGVNSLTISNNDFRDNRGTTPGAYRCAIYSNSANNTLTISNNNILNFKVAGATDPPGYGIYLGAVANGCNITGNSFYMETGFTPVSGLQVIYVGGGNSHNVSGNYIGGSGPGCTGTWTGTLSSTNPTVGIYLTGGTAPASTVQGNTISAFTLGGSGTFAGIQINAGVANVIGNTIGSATVADAIRYSATSSLLGLYNTAPTGVCNFDENTVANITFTIASGTTGMRAMMMYGGNVRKNKIYNIGSLNAAASPTIYGIYNNGTVSTNEFSNNLISLNGGNSGNPALFGFYDISNTSGICGFYFNSINIYGVATGAATTYAFYRGNSAVFTVKNNILANRRTGTGTHYAIFSNSAALLTSDYNDLYTSGAAFGYFGGSAKTNMALWQALPQDLNSVNVDPAFVTSTDLHTAVPQLNNAGQGVAGITNDLANVTRSNPPDIGAYEFTLPITSINTLAATAIGTTTATVNGDINTNNESVTISFEYGLTPGYGSTIAGIPATVRSLSSVPVSADLSLLAPNTIYHYRIVGTSATSTEIVYGLDMTFQTLPGNKTLNLTLFFEGLYNGGGTMREAWNATGPQFGLGIADEVSVDLHDAVTFATVHYTVNNVQVSTSGTASVPIPAIYNGTYYVSVHQRNSIETVTSTTLSFSGSIVNYDFTTLASQTFGDNVKQMPDGKWALYGGDANEDGAIDGSDLIAVENDASIFATGYILTDVNGDGSVDGSDMILVENNASSFISIITP